MASPSPVLSAAVRESLLDRVYAKLLADDPESPKPADSVPDSDDADEAA